ncbi:ribonuclease H-like domain-containing protein [Tanacetum coccineum]
MKRPQHYLTDMQEVILFYNGLDVPTQQILDSKGVIPTKTAADAKVAIQEMAEFSQKWHNGTSLRTRSTKTSDGLAAIQAQLKDLGRKIKKENEKVYTAQFNAPYQHGGQYRAAGPVFYQQNNGNSSYPDRRPSMEESLTKFMTESAKRHEENSNIIKEIRASTDAAIRNQGASIKTLEIQIGQISKVLKERGSRSLPSSTETNPKDQVKSISTAKADSFKICRIECGPYAREAQDVKILEAYDHTLPQKEKDPGSFNLPCFIHNICFNKALVDLGASVSVMPFSTYTNLGLEILSHTRLTIELADRTIKQPRGIAKNVLVRIGKFIFPIDFIILDIPEDDDVPLIVGRPFLSTTHSKIDVYKRKITLRAGKEKLVFKSVKPAASIIKRVFMLKHLDLKTRIIGEGDESFDPIYEQTATGKEISNPLIADSLLKTISFKLLDESQVVLRAPRQNDVYSLDLKNIVPFGGTIRILCLQVHPGKDKTYSGITYFNPIHPHGTRILVEDVVQAAQEKPSENAPKDNKLVTQEMVAKAMDDATRQAFEEKKRKIASQKRAAQVTSINKLNTGRPSVSTGNTPYVSAASTPTCANAGESSFVYLGG